MAAGRRARRSALGLPVAVMGLGAVLWFLGMTPLPPAPAAVTDLVGMTRRASVLTRSMPLQSWHLPSIVGWARARAHPLRRPPGPSAERRTRSHFGSLLGAARRGVRRVRRWRG